MEDVLEPGASAAGPAPATRDRILQVAGELYVLNGFKGFSFGDIAGVIGTTRANIHHHFGNKQRLMDELIEGFVSDAERRIARYWTGSEPFFDRFAAQVEDLRRFYRRFNPRHGDRHAWSPLSRLRLDLPVLGAAASDALERVNATYRRCLRQAVRDAIAAGELAAETPVDDVERVLRVALLSCGPLTQDTGDFGEIEALFASLAAMVARAWGVRPETPGA